MNLIDLRGMLFGRLTVLKISHRQKSKIYWLCKCECGEQVSVSGTNLKTGHTVSCGCFQSEKQSLVITERNLKHGHNALKTLGKPSRTYVSWQSMFQRCYDKNHISYCNYGARGIKVCERWDDFENFLADMGERPENKTLDRINTNGNYEPSNCRWSTPSEQQRNRRDSLTKTQIDFIKNSNLKQKELATLFKVSQSTISLIKKRNYE